MNDEIDTSEQRGAGYTAVIYFHGMGSQRRLEETSRLVDSIDQYLAQIHREGNSRGFLTKIKPQLEEGRVNPSKTFTHIRTIFRTSPKQDWSDAQLVRFHEVYWAPVMAGQKSALGVLKWMGRQILRPFGTLRSPWRERQRLRRASLAALYESNLKLKGVEARDFSMLARRYDDFDTPSALRAYPNGSFSEFLSFLQEASKGRPETAVRHNVLAYAWRSHYRMTEVRNLFLLITMGLALALAGAGALLAIYATLQWFGILVDSLSLSTAIPESLASWQSAVGIGGFLAGLFGLTRFLTDYLGDVEAWATYEETDEKHERRAKVLSIGIELLTQVLGDPRCQRAILIGHSLGSTVAHDTILAVLRDNRARKPQDPIDGPVPLSKIDHFVTIGSPIDKIEYFFESYRSPFHRYRRVVEHLRGDIGTEPFCRNRKPFIHWVNFWDDADLVSGALQSPASARGFIQRVDNVHVASLPFPSPAASHLAYFRNRSVIERIHSIVFDKAFSFKTLPPREGKDRDWESAFIGPAIDPPGRRRAWQWLAIFVPWSVMLGGLTTIASPSLALWMWSLSAAVSLVLFVGWLATQGNMASHNLHKQENTGEFGISEIAVDVSQELNQVKHPP